MDFVSFIARWPEAGDLVSGGGGIRKVRWGRAGTGKRGGVRVIYYYHSEIMPLFLLAIYAKARKQDLTPAELKVLKALAANLRSTYGH